MYKQLRPFENKNEMNENTSQSRWEVHTCSKWETIFRMKNTSIAQPLRIKSLFFLFRVPSVRLPFNKEKYLLQENLSQRETSVEIDDCLSCIPFHLLSNRFKRKTQWPTHAAPTMRHFEIEEHTLCERVGRTCLARTWQAKRSSHFEMSTLNNRMYAVR